MQKQHPELVIRRQSRGLTAEPPGEAGVSDAGLDLAAEKAQCGDNLKPDPDICGLVVEQEVRSGARQRNKTEPQKHIVRQRHIRRVHEKINVAIPRHVGG